MIPCLTRLRMKLGIRNLLVVALSVLPIRRVRHVYLLLRVQLKLESVFDRVPVNRLDVRAGRENRIADRRA